MALAVAGPAWLSGATVASLTTAAFTPAVGTVLLSLSTFDTPTNTRTEATTTVTGSTTAWTKLQHQNTGGGLADANWAKVNTATSTTVRTTWPASSNGALWVPAITGADTTTPIGQSGLVSATATTTITLTATRAGSIVFVAYSSTNGGTVPSSAQLTAAGSTTTGWTTAAWQSAPLTAGSNTITLTGCTAGAGLVWVEVVPPAGAASPGAGTATGTWSFAGTAAGKEPAKGSGTGAWSFAGTATGKRTPKATATGTWTFTSAATGSKPESTIPQGLTATAVSGTQINLAWSPVTAAAGYDIERNGSVYLTDYLATTYSDVGLSKSVSYTYRVRSVSGAILPAVPDWQTDTGSTTSLADETAWLDTMAVRTNRVRNVVIGTSQQGRPIRATIVGPPRSRDQIRAANTIMWIGCIHADEIAGHEALFQTIRDHATSTDTFTIIALTNVNPDMYVIGSRNGTGNMNALWSPTGIDQASDGTAYKPEQQAIRQAILLWRPKFIHDTHEYTSTTTTYRFDPADANTSYSQSIIDTSTLAINAARTAATAAGYTIGTYSGPIPTTGGTEAWKAGGIPSMFTESAQESTGGLTLRRAQHLTTQNTLRQWVKDNAATLAGHAASATWYSGFTPTVTDI